MVQVADPNPLQIRDLRAEPDPEGAAHRWMDEQLAQVYDLSRTPLSHQTLLLLADDRSFYFHRYHHAVLDAFGQAVYGSRVAALYTALATGAEPPATTFTTLDQVVAAETSDPHSRRTGQARAYWLDQFADLPDPVALAGQPGSSTHSSLRRIITLPAELATGLTALADRLGVQWPALAIAATAAFYHRMTGRTDLTFSLPLAGRTGRVSLTTPSAMVNVLPLRVTVDPQATFADLATRVSRSLSDAVRHQRFRGEQLYRELGLSGGRQARLGPTLNVVGFANDLTFGALPAVAHPLSTGPVNDLKINFYGSTAIGTGIRVEFDADPTLYDAREIDAHQQRLVRVLEWVVDHAGDAVSGVDVWAVGELEGLLVEWGGEVRGVSGRSVVELFGDEVVRSPEGVALVCGDVALSYGELDEWSNRVGRWLLSCGVGRE
ncbi:condensation domain-containing protein, partial [Streptomyces sp. HSW2009]|uniref:condensation domain-containing protein n=1 Tax=Streptomyces sp. HSW2009 TaxID=3142890 RepID=UPI0032EAA247